MILMDGISDDGTKVQKINGIITTHSTDDFEREREFQETGVVVALGPTAYAEKSYFGDNWANVGDHVLYEKYDGHRYHDKESDKYYRIVNDNAVLGIFPKPTEK